MIACRNGDEVERGAVVLVDFPYADSKDREILRYKKRPALVVQSDELNNNKQETIVVVITSNVTRIEETRIIVTKGSQCGKNMRLLLDSAIVVDNLAIVKERELERKLGNARK